MSFVTPLPPDADVASRALARCYDAIGGGSNPHVRTAVMSNSELRQEWVHINPDGSKELIVLTVYVGVHREEAPSGR